MTSKDDSPLRAALAPPALKRALVPHRPVFGNPWDSPADMFACYVAVSVIGPLLLWAGGLWQWLDPLTVIRGAALVGAAGFMTIVGRERTSLSVDILAITVWFLLGLVVAPVVGLAPGTAAAIVCYAALLLAIFLYVRGVGRWRTAFLRTVSWPLTWSLVAAAFAYAAHELILYP